MPRSTEAHVTPAVLRWARESMGYSTSEAAHEIGVYTWQLEAAEAGDLLLTMRQAEKLADFYDRPLSTFYLPEPPVEEPAEALFRRLPGAPAPPWPPAMHKLARRVRERQEAAVELYDLLDERPPWLDVAPQLRAGDVPALASRAREILGITSEEQASWDDPQGYTPLRAWVDAVEALGVLVMQDGSLTVAEMRGFASLHPSVPAIVVNTKDDPRARAFTVIHELGHLVAPGATETWCNRFAGQVLMPNEELRSIFLAQRALEPERRIAATARALGVTPLAAELEAKDDRVFSWARDRRDLFVDPSEAVQREIGPISKMLPRAGVRDRADPFVMAEARVRGFTVVTYEGTNSFTGRPTKNADEKMPGMCRRLGLDCRIVPEALAMLGLRF